MKAFTFVVLLAGLVGLDCSLSGYGDRRSHQRRHVINHHEIPVNVEWLTDEQLSELGSLDSVSQVEKIRAFYDGLSTKEERQAAANKIVAQCYDWLPQVTNEEERNELKELHHSDQHNECKQKIGEYIQRLPEERQTQLRKYWSFCEHVWYSTVHHSHHHHQRKQEGEAEVTEGGSATPEGAGEHNHDHHAKRRRREHKHEHKTLDDPSNEHLTWLTAHQRSQLEAFKADGVATSSLDIVKKIAEFFDETTGEQKTKATKELQCACKELIKEVFGEEQVNQLKKMKSDGSTTEQIEREIEKLTAGLSNEEDKKKVAAHKDICKKAYAASQTSRRRRDHHEGHKPKLEDYFKTHLSWLSDDQKDKLRTMKTEGKQREEIQKKIFEFYDQTTGEARDKATELLKGGCRELLRSIIGDAKADEIKQMKESGASLADMNAKVEQYVGEVTDDHKKTMVKEYGPACKKLFGVEGQATPASRRRRDHHEGHHEAHHGGHTLEDYFKTHLSWLDDAQKEQLRTMKAAGSNRAELQKKVYEFFDASAGDTKEKAKEQLKAGCRELLKSVVGEDKANELKTMKESGATTGELGKKVEEFLSQVTDEHKKAVATEYAPYCKKLFGVGESTAAGRRRRHQGHTLDDYLQSHLSWLDDAQKEQLRTMKADGKSKSDIQAKVLEFYDAATGDTKEKATQLLQAGCRQLLKEIVGEDNANSLKALKESGASLTELDNKVQEMLSQVEDEGKKATAKEYGPACKKFFGVKAATRRRMRRDRFDEDGDNQQTNDDGQSSSRRRQQDDDDDGQRRRQQDDDERPRSRSGNDNDEDHIRSHNSWMTNQQQEEIDRMRDEGHNGASLHEKILEFFHISGDDVKQIARGLLSTGCEKLLEKLFGQDNAAEIREMRQQGASPSEIENKLRTAAENIEDEDTRVQALKYGSTCRTIFSMLLRKKRTPPTVKNAISYHHSLNDLLKSHLMWLSYEEKEELRRMKEDGASRKQLQHKVAEFFDKTRGERRNLALKHFKAGCQDLLYSIVGHYRPAELRSVVKAQGVDMDEINRRVRQLIVDMENDGQWMETRELGPSCRKALHISISESPGSSAAERTKQQ